ncbi:MAG: rod shape-determining protein MreC [Pseudomonadales bacterium]|nr:rod shape-determining protein MreC [Pseudomonadales bacterium]
MKQKDKGFRAVTGSTRYVSMVVFPLLLVGLMQLTAMYDAIQNTVLFGSRPLLQVGSEVVSVLTFPFESFFSGVRKEETIHNLSTEVSLLHARVSDLEYVEAENKALRALLENSDRTLDTVSVTTPIVSLAYPAISAGEEDGIFPNRAVVISGTLVGIVSEVYRDQSRVTLLSQNYDFPVLVRTESGVEGVIIGNGRSVIMKHIPREIEITEGERVFTLGQEGIRKNMFVGKIGKIMSAPSAPTKEAVIEQYVSFYDELVVEVW